LFVLISQKENNLILPEIPMKLNKSLLEILKKIEIDGFTILRFLFVFCLWACLSWLRSGFHRYCEGCGLLWAE
jgi:hypothetical protein